MAELTDIFGEDFEAILEKLDDLTPEQELLLLAVIEKATKQAEKSIQETAKTETKKSKVSTK